MTMLSGRIVLCFVLIAAARVVPFTSAQSSSDKLDVLILYESLCPDSIAFMTNQLGPNYDSLKDYLNVTLVPFGKSRSYNQGEYFFCQHGPQECYMNLVQSCVLTQTNNQDAQVKYAVCQMSDFHGELLKSCTDAAGLNPDINDCQNSSFGRNLQLAAEQITGAYAPSFVPTIVYDEKFNQGLQNRSLRDFRGVVCELLQQRAIFAANGACL